LSGTTLAILFGVVVLLLAIIAANLDTLRRQNKEQHEEVMRLLNDFATMVGDLLDKEA
jgi:hypothetical protein